MYDWELKLEVKGFSFERLMDNLKTYMEHVDEKNYRTLYYSSGNSNGDLIKATVTCPVEFRIKELRDAADKLEKELNEGKL